MRGRWSRSSFRSFVLSGVLAVGAVAAVHARESAIVRSASSVGPTVEVVVAAGPIPRGSVLAAASLRTARVPAAFSQPGAVHAVSQAAGRVLLAGLSTGEVVTGTRLARVRAGPVASLIPPGLRAFAVPVNLPRGSLAAGDHVDVLVTFGADASGLGQTQLVAASAEVLLISGGAGTTAGLRRLDASAAGAAAARTVFLLVRPDQESALAEAASLGNLQLVIAPSE